MSAWTECIVCHEEWPPRSFTAAGSAFRRGNVCNACFLERYPEWWGECSGCGKKMHTRAKFSAPMCRPCRAERKVAA